MRRSDSMPSFLRAGERQRDVALQGIALNLEAWSIQVKREKGVYYTLNKFSVDVTRKVLDRQPMQRACWQTPVESTLLQQLCVAATLGVTLCVWWLAVDFGRYDPSCSKCNGK